MGGINNQVQYPPRLPMWVCLNTEGCGHNAHMYYLLMRDLTDRTDFIATMKERDVNCVFHYEPLHNAPYGREVARVSGELSVTNEMADRLVRLPMRVGLSNEKNYQADRADNQEVIGRFK